MVERYAPSAPPPVKNEAVIRLAGWLRGSPPADLAPTGVSGIDLTWRPGASRNAYEKLRRDGSACELAQAARHDP